MVEKTSVCKKVYIDDKGVETRSAQFDSKVLQFRFANGNTHEVELPDHPGEILTCLSWFGISEKYGNAYAGAKGDASVAEELFLSMQEQLRGGTWVEKAEAGPRPSLIADAIIAALTATGQEVNASRAAEIREKVKDKATRDGALKDPVIRGQYEVIKAERATARANAALEAAKGKEISGSF